jgi:hypothetical protein
MKRSTLSVALLYAACGFAVTGAVMLPSSLVADNDPNANRPANVVSTKTFDALVRENEKTGKAELVVTNTTDQSQNVAWTVKVNSAGETSRMSRVPALPKETFTESHKAPLKPHEVKTLAIEYPEGKKNEFRFVLVNIGEKNLPVPMTIEAPTEVSLTK